MGKSQKKHIIEKKMLSIEHANNKKVWLNSAVLQNM